MTKLILDVKCKFSWWFIWYLKSLALFSYITGFEIDEIKLKRFIDFGFKYGCKMEVK